jgi:hypothetical protein
MNILAWVLSITILFMALEESVVFFSATICRQKAWLKATELQTRALLFEAKPFESLYLASCQQLVIRRQYITWQKVSGGPKHLFELPLKGQL